MRIVYTGDPIEIERGEGLSRLSTSIYGVHFPMNAEVDVSHLHPVQQQKLLRNSHFRPADVPASPVAFVAPALEASAPDAPRPGKASAKRAMAEE